MNHPPPHTVPGGPGMPTGSAAENDLCSRNPVAARLRRKTHQALFAIDGELRKSKAAYDALVDRVIVAMNAEDPHEALTHLLAEVQGEKR